ncbi:putative polyadenylate-binding protein [Apostasia shenzhenica]|uniref:Putative polyadenylate-binding protein n=1 Tax=Apostasia shenzhenica TaxID=1088818 RepID=A0A2I0AP37_9ASPA|nr:putative polyadenylate-binding protein [Apostasia shenzhenica]
MEEATPVVVSVPVNVPPPPPPPPQMPVVIEPVKATLYVGDLNPTVKEEDLVRVFECFGAVLSARVCRDRSSGESLGYAYVNFASSSSAESALRAMNHVNLKEKPIRIMWAERNPIGRKNGVGFLNLIQLGVFFGLKNLDESIGGAKLEDLFRPFGRVDSCKVAIDEKGRSRGFGFVQMNTEEAALSAIAALHGYVTKFVRKCERQVPIPQPAGCNNLYIKNLEKDYTDEFLEEKFSEFGKVNSAVVMKDEKGKSKGFGFVSFESAEHANKAMEAMNGSKLGSKTLYVGLAQKKTERVDILKKHFCDEHRQHMKQIEGASVFVKNLSECVTEKALQEHFAAFGKILSQRICRFNSGRSRGFGFVSFSSLEEANKAVTSLNGTDFCGKTIYLAFAKPRQNLFKNPQNQPSSTISCPLVYHQPYYSIPSHNSSIFKPPFNSAMYPMMLYPPHGPYHLQNEHYVNDYYLNQSCVLPRRIEKEMKNTQNPKLHLPADQPILDKSKMEEIFYTYAPKLEQKHASKMADLMLRMNRTKLHENIAKPKVDNDFSKGVKAEGQPVASKS